MLYLVKPSITESYYTLATVMQKHPTRWSRQTLVAGCAHAKEADEISERDWVQKLDAIEDALVQIPGLELDRP